MKKGFSHMDESGHIRMVNISQKRVTERYARARCIVKMKQETLRAISGGKIEKGDVFTAAKIAGIMAAKKVDRLIPLCHPLPINHIEITFRSEIDRGMLEVTSEVEVSGKTGAEMEALQAVAEAALTVYDMCKAVDREMIITDIVLLEKRGGKSGTWERE
jgi:cyclic pyranopterin phosphate synthase